MLSYDSSYYLPCFPVFPITGLSRDSSKLHLDMTELQVFLYWLLLPSVQVCQLQEDLCCESADGVQQKM